jgi:queuine tRNA-ribosyltransferase
LAALRKISEEGVEFRSPVDGTLHRFTPEKSIEVQNNLGADIIMCLDECVAYPCERSYAEQSIKMTLEWAKRCRDAHKEEVQALFGIVQGSVYAELRVRSAEETIGLEFPGYAIGGLSVGEPKELMIEMLDVTVPLLPKDKPRYLMGIGAPQDIVDAIDRGIDMFDCVIPTRNARNGKLYTDKGSISIKQSRYARDERPISERCECYTCKNYSRAYLRHLYLSGEILSSRLNTVHNLHYFLSLVREIREAINSGEWKDFKARFRELLIDAAEEE